MHVPFFDWCAAGLLTRRAKRPVADIM